MKAARPAGSGIRAGASAIAACATVLAVFAACAPGADGDEAVDSLAAGTPVADTVAAPGLREATGIDPADPFSVSPEAVSAYLDETLQYVPAGSYWVQLGGDTPDSAQVRFEVVRGSHLISEDGFASDGHVIHRYILESRDREVPGMGLSAADTLGYLYMEPGVVSGQRTRYNARFVARTAEGGWRATETTLAVIPGVSPPADVPGGSWMVWGAHDDDQYMQSRDAVSRELFGGAYSPGLFDHCFLCGMMWCWVIDPD